MAITANERADEAPPIEEVDTVSGVNLERTHLRPATAAAQDVSNDEALATADPYNQTAWAILFGALVDGYGVSPESFQLTYPYQAWNWATENLGYISPAQYDTLSTLPAWSAIGKYVSTGARFNDQYGAFLNVISPNTTDPALAKKIDGLRDELTQAANDYDRTLQQAKDAYNDDESASKPTFTTWLGTVDGVAWQSRLNALQQTMDQAQANYEAAVSEATTPNLADALEAYDDTDNYSSLNDPALKKMPQVPSWSTPITPAKWQTRAANGDVPGGGISIANSDQAYDFSASWAKGSASVGDWFWRVQVNGAWQRVDTFESDASLDASVQFEGIEEIAIQTAPWYVGVTALANGPYIRGYSKNGGDGTQAVFGEEGFLPMLKTGMYVVYRPSFSIRVSKASFSSFRQTFEGSTGIRIGPFTFTAESGAEKAGWTASESGLSFTGTTDSTEPFIMGYTVKVLP